jgi:hypothetical protein
MPKRVDGNQSVIVAALRAAGCRVQILSMVGKGCPDLLVTFPDQMDWFTCLMECKMPGEDLTPAEKIFWQFWPGLKFIVRSPEDALRQIGKA